MAITASVIFSDDIRVEANGKLILVGVYTGAVKVDSFPATLMFATLATITGLEAGEHEFSIRAYFQGSSDTKEVGSLDFKATVNDATMPIFHHATNLLVQADEKGSLVLEVLRRGGDLISKTLLHVMN